MVFTHRIILSAAAPIVLSVLTACSDSPSVPAVAQPERAQVVTLKGVENLHRVSAELYRSGQPEPEGFTALEQMGVRSVLNLREYHKDTRKARHTDLHLMAYPVAAGQVTAADVENCLRLLQDAPKPALVHCWHGSDRTGIVVAAYRIIYQGWSVDAAEKEFRDDTYGHHEFWYGNLVELLRNTDWQAMKQRLSEKEH
ncbi:MAG: tyrosine-protein phosphatase [Akkermansia sp.]|nr:tyrosine-protein phosphatase [Akkermansia sp.]